MKHEQVCVERRCPAGATRARQLDNWRASSHLRGAFLSPYTCYGNSAAMTARLQVQQLKRDPFPVKDDCIFRPYMKETPTGPTLDCTLA